MTFSLKSPRSHRDRLQSEPWSTAVLQQWGRTRMAAEEDLRETREREGDQQTAVTPYPLRTRCLNVSTWQRGNSGPEGGPTPAVTYCFLHVYSTVLLRRLFNWHLNYMHCGQVRAVLGGINLVFLTYSQPEHFVRIVLNTILMLKWRYAIQRSTSLVNKYNCSLTLLLMDVFCKKGEV